MQPTAFEKIFQRGYESGKEDLVEQIMGVIYAADFDITVDAIVEILEAEIGYTYEGPTLDGFLSKDPHKHHYAGVPIEEIPENPLDRRA